MFPAHEETILSMVSGGSTPDSGMRPEGGRGARRAAWRLFFQLLRCHPWGSPLAPQRPPLSPLQPPEENFPSISSDFQPHLRHRAKPRGSSGLRNVTSTGASGFMGLLPQDTPAGFYCTAFILLPPGPLCSLISCTRLAVNTLAQTWVQVTAAQRCLGMCEFRAAAAASFPT